MTDAGGQVRIVGKCRNPLRDGSNDRITRGRLINIDDGTLLGGRISQLSTTYVGRVGEATKSFGMPKYFCFGR